MVIIPGKESWAKHFFDFFTTYVQNYERDLGQSVMAGSFNFAFAAIPENL